MVWQGLAMGRLGAGRGVNSALPDAVKAQTLGDFSKLCERPGGIASPSNDHMHMRDAILLDARNDPIMSVMARMWGAACAL